MDERTMWYDMGKVDKCPSPITTGVTDVQVVYDVNVTVSGDTINKNEE